MGQTTTSNSTLLNSAAKDDAIGDDGNFTFTVKGDLLNNDPGSTNKIVFNADGVSSQFFFGDSAADQFNQAQYLIDHGIIDNGDGTFTLGEDATDFNYFVQIGNKGTWSEGHVDVTAPVPVEPVNAPPVAVDDAITGDENAFISGSVATNDSDPDDAVSTLKFSTADVVDGLTFNTDGSYVLDTNHDAYRDIYLGETKDVVVNYTVTDPDGLTDTATLTITVVGNADKYSGSESVTVIKGAVNASDNVNQTGGGYEVTFAINEDERADFENGQLTLTAKGDFDGNDEKATVSDPVNLIDHDDFVGSDSFVFTGGGNTGSKGVDQTGFDGIANGDNLEYAAQSVSISDIAFADDTLDFNVQFSGQVDNGSSVTATLTYDFWL